MDILCFHEYTPIGLLRKAKENNLKQDMHTCTSATGPKNRFPCLPTGKLPAIKSVKSKLAKSLYIPKDRAMLSEQKEGGAGARSER